MLKPYIKLFRSLFIAFIATTLVIVGFTSSLRQHNNTKASPVDTSGWNNYSSPITNVSFLYPPNFMINGEPGQTESQDDTNTAPLESYADFTGYHLQYDDSDSPINNAENLNSSSNFQLDIRFYKKLDSFVDPINSTNSSHQQAIAYRKDISTVQATTLRTSSGYTYKLFVTNQEPLLGTAATLMQCTDKGCSQVIRRNSNEDFPYISVQVTSTDGSRYGGAPLNLTSVKYQVFEAILKSLRF